MYNYFKNISQEFRLKKINETRNYFLKEIDQNELISKKHKEICTTLTLWTLSYFNLYNYWICFHFHFCFLDWYSCRNYEFCNRFKNCAIAEGIKRISL